MYYNKNKIPFKLIFVRKFDPEEPSRFQIYEQYPNGYPNHRGFLSNEDSAREYLSYYLNNKDLILVESHENEPCCITSCSNDYTEQIYDCFTATFTYPGVECNLDDFRYEDKTAPVLKISGGVTKHLFGSSPYYYIDSNLSTASWSTYDSIGIKEQYKEYLCPVCDKLHAKLDDNKTVVYGYCDT